MRNTDDIRENDPSNRQNLERCIGTFEIVCLHALFIHYVTELLNVSINIRGKLSDSISLSQLFLTSYVPIPYTMPSKLLENG